MAKSRNHVDLTGNVGSDVELSYLASGTAALNLRIATNERRKSGEEWVDHTEWHSVTIYGRLAEIVADYVKKGQMIQVIGYLRTRQWEDKEGNTRYTTEVVARDAIFGFAGGATNGSSNAVEALVEDDMPF
jgi:single-strand DNA-binding protein